MRLTNLTKKYERTRRRFRVIENMTADKFMQYLRALCVRRVQQAGASIPKPMSESDYLIFQVMRANGILEKITPEHLVGDATLGTCGDDDRVWECYKHFRKGTSKLQGEPSKFFPFSGPGGPLVAHPAISRIMGYNYFAQLIQMLALIFVAKGHTVYKAVGHTPCGVAGLLEMSLVEVVLHLIELCELVEKFMSEYVPGFVARPLLHVDRRGYVADEQEWMQTYRIIPARFYAWCEAGYPMNIDVASA